MILWVGGREGGRNGQVGEEVKEREWLRSKEKEDKEERKEG